MAGWFPCAVGALGLVRCVATAWSQASPTTMSTHADSVPRHHLSLDGGRLRPVQLTYRTAIRRDSVESFVGVSHVQVAETTYAGMPAWLLTRLGPQGTTTATDSLVVARADLRPLHWTATLGVARLAAEFTPDTIFAAMSSPLGRQSIVVGNRGDLLVSTGAMDAALAVMPLSVGWRDSASVLVIDGGGAAIAPAYLIVESEEHLTAPAGEFDCWIVSVETERATERIWVSKLDQTVVRSEQILPQLASAVLERVLVQADTSLPPAAIRQP